VKTKVAIITALTLGFAHISMAQISSRIDQYFLDPSSINPAAINFQKYGSLNLFYNKTFAGVTGAPENVIANLVMPLKNEKTAFGVFYQREKAGFQQLHNAFVSYAYAIPLSDETKLSFGVSLGVLNQSFDASKAIYLQNNDPVIRSIAFSPSATRVDFRASAMIKAGDFFGGFAFSRFAKPMFDYSYYNYKTSYSLQSLSNLVLGYSIAAGEDFAIKPTVLLNFYDFKYTNFKGNISAYYKDKFWLGVGTDASSQIGFNVGVKVADAIVCGYSVNVLAGKMKDVLGPVHEFYTSFPFGGGKKIADDEEEVTKKPDGETEEKVETEPAKTGRRLVETTVSSYNDLKNAGADLDTAGIHFTQIEKEKKEPGIYLVVGMHASESKAESQIKSLYLKGIYSYKFYDPINHQYYVWIKQFKSMAEASKFVQNADNSNWPEAWIRVVK
jgi:type IX secretion system PorP/SprF family membrane protein